MGLINQLQQKLPAGIQQKLAKDPTERVDDTVEFILSCFPAWERAAAKTYLQKYVGFRAPNATLMNTFSNQLSTRGSGNPGDERQRMMRRALIMLEAFRDGVSVNLPDQIRQMPTGNLSGAFEKVMADFRLEVDQAEGTGTGTRLILDRDLKGRTERLLGEKSLLIHGSVKSAGLVNIDNFFFTYHLKRDQFSIKVATSNGLPKSPSFSAITVPAVAWSAVQGRGSQQTSGSFAQLPATELTGADVMVTTQFSGCSFCFKTVNGRTFAAHIGPSDGLGGGHIAGGGLELARQLSGQVGSVTAADFTGVPAGGVVSVFGNGYSNLAAHAGGYDIPQPNGFMTVIGIRAGANWKLYSQTSNGASKVMSLIQLM